jgi:Flp pilus assembly protein TadG
MVEFALIATVLFLLIFGMLDLAIIEVGNSDAANAARDGARVGIVNTDCVDSYTYPPTAAPRGANHDGCMPDTNNNYLGVKNAVLARLSGLVGSPTVTVGCYQEPANTPEDCFNTTYTPDQDVLQVTIVYTSQASSPFAKTTTHSQTARMIIVGAPIIPASICTLVTGGAVPNPNSVNDGKLGSDITVTVTTSGACIGPLTADVPPGDGADQTGILTGGPTSWSGTIDGSEFWTAGTKIITITAPGLGAIGTIAFTVS